MVTVRMLRFCILLTFLPRCCPYLQAPEGDRIRVLRLSLVVILVLLLVAGALTTLLPNIKEDKMLTLRREIKSQGKPTQDSFTLIMQTLQPEQIYY